MGSVGGLRRAGHRGNCIVNTSYRGSVASRFAGMRLRAGVVSIAAVIATASCTSTAKHQGLPTPLPSTPSPVGSAMPHALSRALHFPQVRAGKPCPASSGMTLETSDFGGIALGHGPIRPIIGAPGDLRQGVAELGSTDVAGWMALQVLWVSLPSYHGPFVIRPQRLDSPGKFSLRSESRPASLFVLDLHSAHTFGSHLTFPCRP